MFNDLKARHISLAFFCTLVPKRMCPEGQMFNRDVCSRLDQRLTKYVSRCFLFLIDSDTAHWRIFLHPAFSLVRKTMFSK